MLMSGEKGLWVAETSEQAFGSPEEEFVFLLPLKLPTLPPGRCRGLGPPPPRFLVPFWAAAAVAMQSLPPPPPQHQGCSNTSCSTNLGRHWGKYLTCPAPDRCGCAACGSRGSRAGTLAQAEPRCGKLLPACLAHGAGCVLGHAKPWPPRDAQ